MDKATEAEQVEILRLLKLHHSINRVSELTGKSLSTIRKIRDYLLVTDRTTGGPVISFRLSYDELRLLDQQALSYGFSRAKLLRCLCRNVVGIIEMEPEARDEMQEISKGLGRIGSNLNQLVKLAHIGKLRCDDTLPNFITAVRNDVGQVSAVLASYVAASHRKSTALLKRTHDRLLELSET
jgi:hypothetical protein|tara:strand:- start:9285 stop:9830 length:546 start_codon:yes stop_codon:yes gene_type:complete